jgi:hypothetical protein
MRQPAFSEASEPRSNGEQLREHARKQALVDLEDLHLTAHVLDRHAHTFAAGGLVKEFHLAASGIHTPATVVARWSFRPYLIFMP